jgi:hypothetical protein
MKQIDLNKSVYELTEQYPELIDVLKELGFLGVRNAITRQPLGRVTSIPQGCQKMDKDLNEVIKIFKEKGFEIKP